MINKNPELYKNEKYDMSPEEYEDIVDWLEETIGEGCPLCDDKEWLEFWKQLNIVEMYPMTNMFDDLMVYRDIYDMRFIVLSTRPFCIYPWEPHYIPSRLLETFLREARIHGYDILVNPHLEEYDGRSLLIDASSGNLTPVVAKYNDERRSYDIY